MKIILKSILFDCYGTLISTGNGSILAVEQILKLNNSEMDPADFYNAWKRIHHDVCKSYPFKLESEAFEFGLSELYRLHSIKGNVQQDVRIMLNTLGNRVAFPESNEVITKLAGKYQIVVGSNSDHQPLIADLTTNKLRANLIFSSESLGVYKPNKEFFSKMLKELNLKPDEVVYVGDSQIDDIQGAYLSGIESIWINRKKELLLDDIPRPGHEFESLSGLLKLIL